MDDSRGPQEETTILRVPCFTLRKNTERPITIEIGKNTLVGNDPKSILLGFERVIKVEQTIVSSLGDTFSLACRDPCGGFVTGAFEAIFSRERLEQT